MPYTTLVSTETIAAHLEMSAVASAKRDGRWAIVDCRFDLKDEAWGRAQYLESHIPGAVYASLNHDLAGERTGANGRHPVPSIEALAAVFGRLGIDSETQVVAYDQDAGMYASRLWWSLRFVGHRAVALLDGGWAKWVREGRPTRAGEESRAATTFEPAPQADLHAAIADVDARIGRRAALLVDARAPERFEGVSETIDRVAGHIPGAVNHFYKWNLNEDGTFLPAGTLRERYERLLAGRAPDEAVMYCGSGVTACHNLLAMEHAGLPGTKLYPGSWSEWSSDPSRPIETGPAR
jgi:thiosulfate/3-mercaptopyruvate sulfurtransferase